MRLPSRLLVVPAACVALGSLTACSGGSNDTATDSAATPPSSSTSNATTCSYPASGQAAKPVQAPSAQATEQGTIPVTITTNDGTIGLTLDADNAPCTVHSFLSLAQQGYFDNTPCHRLVPGFVLQCGDPTGQGTGGPGYSFKDELSGSETYTRGVLAMANAGPDTNGSQFFIMLADAPGMPANYTVFGTVSNAGMQVVDAIAAKGTKGGVQDGPPAQPVTIESVKQ